MLTLPFSDVHAILKNKYVAVEREDNLLKCILLWTEANSQCKDNEV